VDAVVALLVHLSPPGTASPGPRQGET
jgi:hypothetical protein